MFYLSTLYGLAFCYAGEVKAGGAVESFSTAYSRDATDSKEGQLFTAWFMNVLSPPSLANHRNVPRKRILSRPLIAPTILSRYNSINFFVVVSSQLYDYYLREYYDAL
jgi:hypothetical protein